MSKQTQLKTLRDLFKTAVILVAETMSTIKLKQIWGLEGESCHPRAIRLVLFLSPARAERGGQQRLPGLAKAGSLWPLGCPGGGSGDSF